MYHNDPNHPTMFGGLGLRSRKVSFRLVNRVSLICNWIKHTMNLTQGAVVGKVATRIFYPGHGASPVDSQSKCESFTAVAQWPNSPLAGTY